MMKEKCDGCEAKLNPNNYNIVKFRTLEDEKEIYGSEIQLCPDCLDNIEKIVEEESLNSMGGDPDEPL